MPKNDSKKKKKRIEIKEKQNGEQKLPNEDLLSEKLLQPMVQLSYAAAMDLVQARLRLINADLTEQCHRQVIRNMSCRIKTPDSVTKKLKKKGREVSFEEAVQICVEEAVPGDAILLSPACASWGMFKNYEERGDKFKELVNRL